MTIRDLLIFNELYKTLNMTTTAKNLFMTQPSVSHALKELETYYDRKLFERLAQKLYPTKAGDELYQYSCQILSLLEEAKNNIKSGELIEPIRIGGNYTMGIHKLNELVEEYSKLHLKASITVSINKASYIKDLLRKSQLDLALIEESLSMGDSDMIQIPFCRDKIVAVVSKEHPLAKVRYVTLEDIKDECFLTRERGVGARDMFESIMHSSGYAFHPTWESISATSLINAAKKKAGIAILPYESVKEILLQGDLVELRLK